MLYGVTGSGKTHTVFGSLGYKDPNNCVDLDHGIIYYCFEKLMAEQDCSINLSYLEIYNEQVKDLLGLDDNLMVGENGQGEVQVQGLSTRRVSSFDEMIEFIKEGNSRRKMAKTCANAFSSRSHAILQIHLRKRKGNTIMTSKLSFIDLAGSERVEMTQNKGARLAEGSNINKSLLALGKVINKLSEKASDGYVPYRDSKLTRLLKDSLGGNTKTVLITCVSSNRLQVDEMIHSLNYAARAKKIKLQVEANLFDITQPQERIQEPALVDSQVPLMNSYVEEIEELRVRIVTLESELQREKGGRSNIESSYNQLLLELQEQWEIRNSIIELTELQNINREKLSLKKRQLVDEDFQDIKRKKLLIEEIRDLEDISIENDAIKRELDKRLSHLEEKRAGTLGLKNRSVSPIILNRARKRRDDEVSITPVVKSLLEASQQVTEKKTTKSKSVIISERESVIRPSKRKEDKESMEELTDVAKSDLPHPLVKKEKTRTDDRTKLNKDLRSSVLNPIQIRPSVHNTTSDSQSAYDLILFDGDEPLVQIKSPSSNLKEVSKTIDFNDYLESHNRPIQNQKHFTSIVYEQQQETPKSIYNYEDARDSSQRDYDQMKQELQNSGSKRDTSREQRIQQKLQIAREKMREFKKKLNLMRVFLVKYETKAIQKCSIDIYKVAVLLLKEQNKQKYLLTEEENDILSQMAVFSSKFKKLHSESVHSDSQEDMKENLKNDANIMQKTIGPSSSKNEPFNYMTDRFNMSKSNFDTTKDHYLTTTSVRQTKPEKKHENKTESMISKINRILN